MKRILLIMLALALCLPQSSKAVDVSADSTLTYALILVETPLYRQSMGEFEQTENIFFILPDSYFVIVSGAVDQNGLIPCEYDGLSGFVLSSDVEIVDYEPRYVFPEPVTLILKGEITGLRLRKTPDNSQKEILIIPESAGSIRYYNYIEGQDLDGSGNRWYYVNYQESFGYVYNGYIVIEDEIPQNTIEAVAPPLPEPEPNEGENDTITPPKDLSDYIFIGILSLPVVIIIVLLFKGGKPKYYTRPPAPRPPKYLDD